MQRSPGGKLHGELLRANRRDYVQNAIVRTEPLHTEAERQAGVFATTHWSIVLAASSVHSPQALEALEKLCCTYWYPLYAFVRRQGASAEDAEDLTQAFFAHLFRKDFLSGVGPEKGRFRSFLLACLKHFLADHWDKARRLKRGGASPALSLDIEQAEERYRCETLSEPGADQLYERRWALDLLACVLGRLRQEAVEAGKAAIFDQLQGCLVGERPDETYAESGVRLGLSQSAVKVTVHRLRQRYRQRLREEIAHTVADPGQIDEELRYLLAVVSR
jgi:RNA polymerase sigma-70 factor (ECF subfamily)